MSYSFVNGNSVLSTGTELSYLDITTLGTSQASKAVTVDANGDLIVPDSDKFKFGAGSDMQLYHDGSDSYITNAVGALKIATETTGIAITIGHGTSETTVADNLTVTGTSTFSASISVKNGATSAGFVSFYEDSDNGTNTAKLIGPASTADVTVTLPAATDTLVGKATTDTLTNKTLTSPDINTPDIDGGTIDGVTLGGTLAGTPTFSGVGTHSAKDIFQAGMTISNGGSSAGFIDFVEQDGATSGSTCTFRAKSQMGNITITLPGDTGTVVLEDNTVTLSNKTFTDPVINVSGTDATGDVYYRNGSGIFTRLAIGSDDQVLTLASGLPSWADAAGGGSMSQFILEDDDGTEVSISNNEEVKFIGSGLTTNWTDVSPGSDGDPFDLTFTVDAAQTVITSIYNASLKVGRDSQNLVDFATTDNKIIFRVNNVNEVELVENALSPVTSAGVALGTTSLMWSNLFLANAGVVNFNNGDVTLTHSSNTLTVAGGNLAATFVGDITGDVTGTADTATVATTVTITDNESTNEENAVVFTAGGDVDGGNLGLESDGTLTYNPSTGTVTATIFKGNIDAVDGDFDGTLEADAITVAGTALNEYIADTVGAMVGSNTESGITVAYQDGDNTLDFTVGTLNQDTTGTAAIATTVTITDNENTDEDNAIIFTAGGDVDGGNLGLESDGNLTYNPSTGNLSATLLTGTCQTAAQTSVTSLGTLTALTVDDVAVDGKVITMTGSSSDTAVFTAGTNGTLSIVTTDAAAAAANIQITADGTVDIDSAGVLTLDSGAAINIEPAAGSAILLDGTISVDAGIVTGATSITSTAFVGDITGDVTGTADTATVATTVTITDNESTNEENAVVFTAGGDVDGGNLGLESDGTLTYNPSTGTVTSTIFKGNIDAVDGDFDGTLEADAITVAGTALNEYIADTVGAMVGSNTESGITVAYQDGDNTLDFTVGTLNQDTTGTAAIATTVTITDNESTNETNAIIFTAGGDVDGGNLGLESDGDLTYNPSTGKVSATIVAGSTSLQTALIEYTDGDDSMTIADGGKVTFASGFAVGSDAAGDVLYHNGTSYVRLAKGSDDEVLTLASGVPSWAAASGGSDGWHGSTTRIKILARDFHPDDASASYGLLVEDDTAPLGIRTGASSAQLFAYVPIPTGFKATHVQIYDASDDSAIEVFEGFIDGTDAVSKGTGAANTELDITDVTSSTTNFLIVNVQTNHTTDVTYGGYVTIAAV